MWNGSRHSVACGQRSEIGLATTGGDVGRHQFDLLPEAVRPSACEAEATVVTSVGESVSEVDLETAEGAGQW
jgi:hypothetical protein